MINIPGKGGLKLLTPQEVKTYLNKKPEYKKIWNELIPYFFDAQEFCDIVNKIRIKRIQETEKINKEIERLKSIKDNIPEYIQHIQQLKKEKNMIFQNILREMFSTNILPKIRNTSIDFKEVNQLIGSLSNFNRVKKEEIQEISEIANTQLYEDLTMDIYEEEILFIMDELIDDFFKKQETGNVISEGEKKEFSQQAWNIFLSRHKDDIERGKIDINTLIKYLYKKKIFQ